MILRSALHVFRGPEFVEAPMRWRTSCSCGWEKVVHASALSAAEAEHIREIENDAELRVQGPSIECNYGPERSKG